MSEALAFDVVIIGSGFGGSVSALRLAEKDYRVAVLEAGKRLRPEDFPKSNRDVRKFLWAPKLGCHGLQRISFLRGLMLLHGAGVGGGSLVYAATLMKPLSKVFETGWPSGVRWEEQLAPAFERARKMLGVSTNPKFAEADLALRELGRRLGVPETFHATEVGIHFGPGKDRTPCNFCGGCMIGCGTGSKNSLDQNYLRLAEQLGTGIFPETEASRIEPLPEGGYRIETLGLPSLFRRPRGRSFVAKKVIVAAGVLGTVELLLRNRDVYRTLPNLSARLGETVRTNGESLLGATTFDETKDLSAGVAIGSAIHPDERTKIEVVRYASKSDMMKWLAIPLTPGGTKITRPAKLLVRLFTRGHRLLRLWRIRDWARSTAILLVMQTIDQTMRLRLKRSFFSGFSLSGGATERPIPSYFPIAQKSAAELAEIVNGEPQNAWSEVLFGTPATAHILGGCCLGETPEDGVVDSSHEVFGHPGLYVCDGSVIPTNLAVNPSLTIAALAERFVEKWPRI